MKLAVTVTDGVRTWDEVFDLPQVTDGLDWANTTIDQFNATLRPAELPRKFVAIKELDGGSTAHAWLKTGLMAKQTAKGLRDTYECQQCGVTAQRLLGKFHRDTKYQAYGYADCAKAKVLMDRRANRQAKKSDAI